MCDEYINPLYDEVEGSGKSDSQGNPYSGYNCTGPDRGATWNNEFDGGTGILSGAGAGYSFAGQNPNSPLGGFRVELEYFYRQSNYDQTSSLLSGSAQVRSKLGEEIVIGIERIGSITSHNLFGNLYYDFVNTAGSRLYRSWCRLRVYRPGVWNRLGEESRRTTDLDRRKFA